MDTFPRHASACRRRRRRLRRLHVVVADAVVVVAAAVARGMHAAALPACPRRRGVGKWSPGIELPGSDLQAERALHNKL